MIRNLLVFLALTVLYSSCFQTSQKTPEPKENPHVLQPDEYVPAMGRVVDMDAAAKPKYTPVRGHYVKGEKPTYSPVTSNYRLSDAPAYKPAKGRLINMDTLAKPLYFPAQGKRVVSAWPKWTATQAAFKEDPAFFYLDVEQGLNSGFVRSLIEDQDGRIWIGTFGGGVSVWNGDGFLHYTQAEGLSQNGVWSLLEDRNGHIWIGTIGGGISVWDGNGFTHFTEEEGLSGATVRSLLEDRDGRIWIGTYGGGISVWDGKGFIRFTQKEGLSGNTVRSLLEDQAGRIWIGTYDGGISVWDPAEGGRFTHFTQREGLSNNKIRSLLEDRDGRIWIGTYGGGVNVWDGRGFAHFTQDEGLSGNNVRSLLEDRDGRVWIGTYGGGVNVWDGKGFTHFTQAKGLSNNNVRDLLEDEAGRIWIGTYGGGLSVWSGNGFTHFTKKEGLSDNNVRSLLKDKQGRLWIGILGGGVNLWDGNGFTHYTQTEGLSHNEVNCLLEDREGNIWIGIWEGGLSKWDGTGFTYYQTNGAGVWSLLEDRKGKIWAGTEDGLDVWDGNGYTRYTTAEGLSNNNIRNLLEDRNGRIWIGTDGGGVNVWDPANGGGFTHYTTDEGLSHNYVRSLLEDEDGHIWIGTRGGVSLWDGRGFFHYTQAGGLSNNAGRSLLQDARGDIWVGTYKGLNRLDRLGDEPRWGLRQFLKPDGLMGISVMAMQLDRQENLWLATPKGLSRLDMQNLSTETAPPTLTLRELQPFFEFVDWRKAQDTFKNKVGGGRKGTSQILARVEFDSVSAFTNLPVKPVFPPDLNHLTFRWNGVYPSAQHQLQYRYILEGNDDAWSPLVPNNQATFQNLSPGRYIFKVKAVSPAGRWSKTIAYSFRIRPPWWFSWSAYLIYGLIVLGALFYIRRLELKRQKRRLHIERQKLLRREKELEQERVLNEELQRVDQLKDQFLANTSHGLRTPLQGIIGLSESLIERVTETRQKEDLSMIISSGKRLNSLINDILDFSKLKNYDIELNCKAVNLRVLADIILRNSAVLVKQRSLALINDVPVDFPAVSGDENRLLQVLYNLVGNAIKFTEKGYVKIGASLREPQITTFNDDRGKIPTPSNPNSEKSSWITIFVEDTGIGVPAAKQEAIFREFEQVDGSISQEFAGTGLGLSISKRLIELHGGQMWVESPPTDRTKDELGTGAGSRFLFTLPVSTEKLLNAPAAQPMPLPETEYSAENGLPPVGPIFRGEGGRKEDLDVRTGRMNLLQPLESELWTSYQDEDNAPVHILIVDDEPINQQVLKNHLSNERYHLTHAMNGEEALKALEGGARFDLVLLDLMMPRMSGYEVCEKIRQKYLPSELPVIMVTAKNQAQDLVQGLSLGANDYLAKPFSKAEFLARVKTHINLHQINKATGRFVPYEFLRSLGRESITDVQLGDLVEREVTVLFSDIRSYTRLVERMSPQDNFRFVNAYSGRMGPIIQARHGFINQYLGDGIMAIFQKSAQDALRAAIEMQGAIRNYNNYRRTKNRRPIKIGIGLHAGSLIMGIIGDKKRTDAATISDTVNTASRMEGLTKHYGVSIIVSEDSLRKINLELMGGKPFEDGKDLQKSFYLADFNFRYLGKVLVKGKEKPIGVYECFDGDPSKIIEKKLASKEPFDKGLQAYFIRDFAQASAYFKKALKRYPKDRPAQLFYQKALQYMDQGVPENWTGVETMLFK